MMREATHCVSQHMLAISGDGRCLRLQGRGEKNGPSVDDGEFCGARWKIAKFAADSRLGCRHFSRYGGYGALLHTSLELGGKTRWEMMDKNGINTSAG
ncbi:Uncharacterized protein APZ42_026504 [Daphnia magna]|uniref:Uncharacterized protein n=1 Tax=Daphnia magna TaxID=35525 RepID=A0A164S9Z0_9CRUS|nr:Uncharacterized protein APZ42_026504 [Daphnia magna]